MMECSRNDQKADAAGMAEGRDGEEMTAPLKVHSPNHGRNSTSNIFSFNTANGDSRRRSDHLRSTGLPVD